MLTKYHNNQFPSPCISISSSTIELLNWIKQKTGYGRIQNKKNYNPKKYKDSYTYTVKYNNALNLLENIAPYLVIEYKKKRANLILEKYKILTPRNGRYSKEMIELKNSFYNEFIALK